MAEVFTYEEVLQRISNPVVVSQTKSLESEEYRSYWLLGLDDQFVEYRIEYPVALRISPSGTHYVIDRHGVVHCLPTANWETLTWKSLPRKYFISF